MLFSVPQFIDVEDKIAGPLTWRQLLWLIGMAVLNLVIYNMLGLVGFLVLGIPVVLLFCALAFYRPQGQPLISLLLHGILYFFRPKVAVWERPVARAKRSSVESAPAQAAPAEKRVTPEELRRLAQLMDNR
jgi:hypothetical protein